MAEEKHDAEGVEKLRALLAPLSPRKRALVGSPQGPGSPQRRRGIGRLQEKEEDAALLKSDMADLDLSAVPTHFTTQPPFAEGKMRDYQLEALNWLINLYDNGSNGILADEMGLGKTLESISMLGYLKHFRNNNGPHLIIVPKSTSSNWMREIKRWCPALTAFKLHGNKDERIEQKKRLGTTDIVVTTYEIAIREKGALAKLDWDYIYIDEAHRIKNEQSLLSKVVRLFKSKHRLLITGTPLQNNLKELWALLNFLLPEKFPAADDFEDAFEQIQSDERDTAAERLHKILRRYMLRRLKTDVEKSLPPKIETKLFVGLTKMQQSWYEDLLSKDIDVLNAKAGKKVRLLNILMQLRKVCNHPYLFTGAEPGPPFEEGAHLWENCGKMILLHKLLQKLKSNGSRVLIFSQMTRMLDILEDYCLYNEYEYCRIDGSTKQDDRDEAMDSYNAPGSSKFAFLLSTRAGGLGINLQTADTVILYDSDWNPQVDLQAQDRAHRIGQKKVVNVYRFVTEGTCEEKIVQRATEKLYLDALIVQQGRLKQQDKNLSKDEVQEMVRFGAQRIFASKEGTITDEDIDAIIAKGAERTAAENEKLKTNQGFSLSTFSMSDEPESVYVYGGKDWRSKKGKKQFEFISLPDRQAKADSMSYDINKYYRNALRTSGPDAQRGREFKENTRHEWQFFNRKRLNELDRKDFESKKELRRLQQEAKLKKKREEQQRKLEERKAKRVKREGNGNDGSVGSSEEGTEAAAPSPPPASPAPAPSPPPAADDAVNAKKRRKSSQSSGRKTKQAKTEQASGEENNEGLSLEARAGLLTEEEQAEREHLLEQGFPDWNKRHFLAFIRANETHGRDRLDQIKQSVDGKTPAEVEEYYYVFWKRYKEMDNWKRYIAQITKGEERLDKHANTIQILKKKVGMYKNPLLTLTFDYRNSKSKTFNEEEDRFLICTCHEVGWGEWHKIKAKIRDTWMFRFDWFLKSRTPEEIRTRCQYLVKLLEKEFNSKGTKTRVKKRKPKAIPAKIKRRSSTKLLLN